MAKQGEIDLKQLKALYKIDDIVLVDSRALEAADDCRLYFEISLSIGLTLLGAIISRYDQSLMIACIIFLLVALFFLGRYIIKRLKISKNTKKSNE